MNYPCCDSPKMIDDYAGGGVVCCNCGVVSNHFLIDDRPCINTNPFCLMNIQKWDPCEVLLRMGIDSDNLGEICLNLYLENSKPKTNVLKAEIIYKVCSESGFVVSKDLICNILDVKSKKIADTTSINTTLSTRIRPLAKAIIGDTCHMKISKVMAGVMKMESALLRDKVSWKMYISKKPSKIDPILLYMSCIQNDIVIKKEDFVKYSSMSIVTFTQHFKMIEKIFKV